MFESFITKTCLYKFDPLQPHFYVIKTGVCRSIYYFSYFAKNIDCEAEAVLTSTHNLCFEQKFEKYLFFYLRIFELLEMKSSIYLNRYVFVMEV